MNLIFFDLTLLVLFLAFASHFLYKNRRNLKKDGSLFLYRTQWGVKLIDRVGGKYQKTLKVLSYVSIGLGYILMVGMVYLLIQSVYIYLTTSIVQMIKIPPVLPLLPYFTELPGIKGIFPTFYFIHFIVAIAIVATVHEFSHGIFARRYKIGIKSTGFAFLKYFPVFFGAFVEQNDKDMEKRKKFEQMSVLSAGVFANILVVVLFYFILFGFSLTSFTASGVVFNDYAYTPIILSSITSVNGIALDNPTLEEFADSLEKDEKFNDIIAGETEYVGLRRIAVAELEEQEIYYAELYNKAPAIEGKLKGAITNIDGVSILSKDDLSEKLKEYSPGETITIRTIIGGEIENYEVILGENPNDESLAFLGIAFSSNERNGMTGKIFSLFPSYKKPNVYYEPNYSLAPFVQDLLWWIVIINLLVALFNMLPLGILDGGRFFYLTIFGLTKSKRFAKGFFVGITYAILILFVSIMIKWLFSFF